MAKSVLIVDDIEFVRKTLSDILTHAHYNVVGEACDGAQAVEMYKRLKPDLITMDIVMPKMSGLEATRKIISIEKNAKIIIISAMGQESLVMEAINSGAKDYVLKPFNTKEILRTVERAMIDDVGPTTGQKLSTREQKVG